MLNLSNLNKNDNENEDQTISCVYNLLANNDTVRWNGDKIKIRPPHGLTNIRKVAFRSFTGDYLPALNESLPKLKMDITLKDTFSVSGDSSSKAPVAEEAKIYVANNAMTPTIIKYSNSSENKIISLESNFIYKEDEDDQIAWNIKRLVGVANDMLNNMFPKENITGIKWSFTPYQGVNTSADLNKYIFDNISITKEMFEFDEIFISKGNGGGIIGFRGNNIFFVIGNKFVENEKLIITAISPTNISLSASDYKVQCYVCPISNYIIMFATGYGVDERDQNIQFYSTSTNVYRFAIEYDEGGNPSSITSIFSQNESGTPTDTVFTPDFYIFKQFRLQWMSDSSYFYYGFMSPTIFEGIDKYGLFFEKITKNSDGSYSAKRFAYQHYQNCFVASCFGLEYNNYFFVLIQLIDGVMDDTYILQYSKISIETGGIISEYTATQNEPYDKLKARPILLKFGHSSFANIEEAFNNKYFDAIGFGSIQFYTRFGETGYRIGWYTLNPNEMLLWYNSSTGHYVNAFFVNEDNKIIYQYLMGYFDPRNYTSVVLKVDDYDGKKYLMLGYHTQEYGGYTSYKSMEINYKVSNIISVCGPQPDTFIGGYFLDSFEGNTSGLVSLNLTNTEARTGGIDGLTYGESTVGIWGESNSDDMLSVISADENDVRLKKVEFFNVKEVYQVIRFYTDSLTLNIINSGYGNGEGYPFDLTVHSSTITTATPTTYTDLNTQIILNNEYNDLQLRCSNFPNNDNIVFTVNEPCEISFKEMDSASNNQELNIDLCDFDGNPISLDLLKKIYGKLSLCIDWKG